MEQKQIFRQKSLDRVSSPEELNSHIRVVNPGVWLLLCAVGILLVGALVWSLVTTLNTRTVTAAAVCRNGRLSLYVTAEDKDFIKADQALTINGETYLLPKPEFNAEKLFPQDDIAILQILDESKSEYAYVTKFDMDLPNGIYTATIDTDPVDTADLVLN